MYQNPLTPHLHDQAIIKQTSSKRRAIRAHVVHVYFECICSMFAWSCKRGISPSPEK